MSLLYRLIPLRILRRTTGVKFDEIMCKTLQAIFDLARINIGHLSGIFTRFKKYTKRLNAPLLTCHDHDVTNGYKVQIVGKDAPRRICTIVNIINDWCVFMIAGERHKDYLESVALY